MNRINEMKKQFFEKFKMKDLNKVFFILSIQVIRHFKKKKISLTQFIYIRKFLHEYEMRDAHSVATPIDDYSALTSSNANEPRIDQREYQKRIENIMYAMIEIRPDLAFAVEKLNQYCQNPSIRHRTALDRVLRYLKKTADLQLIYDGTIDPNPTCYADAAYGDDAIDKKSTYDNALLIKNGAVT